MKACFKNHWPWLLVALFAVEAALSLRPRKDAPEAFQLREWGKLPALLHGRVQPLDSIARNSLLVIRGNTDVPLEGNGAGGSWGRWEDLSARGGLTERKWYQFGKHPKKLRPTDWLLEVFSRADLADTRYIFLIHHPELLGELKLQDRGVERSGLRYFAFDQLKPSLGLMEREARQIGPVKPELRTHYQRSLMSLHNALQIYLRLKNSVKPERSQDFAGEIAQFERLIPAGFRAVQAQQAGRPHDEEVFNRFLAQAEPYAMMKEMAYPLLLPPPNPEVARTEWVNMGQGILDGIRSGGLPASAHAHAALVTAFAQGQPGEFNRALADYSHLLARTFGQEVTKGRQEHLFNQFLPFYRSMMIYIVALLLAAGSWLVWSQNANRAAFRLLILAFLIHTTGLIFRMFLEGRPPVTNLYSSAIFVGWGAVLLGMILERIFRNGIGTVTAASVGFITLIIAHHLAQSSSTGDTMEMMRAVLDTNFWLATHVVVITIGYASTFLAGFLAILYVLRGVFTRSLDAATAQSLVRMVYGIVCFATLFSFVGTILGGIWADQSWGRFWGWDPKENGALLIVLWNALILHARWGKLVGDRGLMNLAIFGNIITGWSWFGTNMLGVGLHSYGFMDAAFKWLMLFNTTQIVLIALGSLPPRFWLSLRGTKPATAAA